MGKKLKMPAKSVSYRVKKLEDAGMIEGYTITVDYDALGFERFKVFIRSKSMSEERERAFIEWARTHPYCLYWSKSIATSDVELELVVKDSIHLRKVVAELREKYGDLIKSYETMKIWKEFKLNFIPWVRVV
ncbi:MAG: Lrp/AsnC family transcriptional regulator [DPANN group archaeon]|nr:Lrp/AsnC family transcriptional regulator [DPANN group archaeon]